jgi:hypothetical protein
MAMLTRRTPDQSATRQGVTSDTGWLSPVAGPGGYPIGSPIVNGNPYAYSDFLSGDPRLVKAASPSAYDYYGNYIGGPETNEQQKSRINDFFNAWTGRSTGDAFVPYKSDMGGNIYERSREEKASGYQDIWPEEYAAYISGSISSRELTSRAMATAVSRDRDTIGNAPAMYTLAPPPTVRYSFTRSGGGSVSSKLGTVSW